MINDFIDKTVKLLNTSDIRLHMPEHRKLELGETQTVYIECSDISGAMQIEDNLIFHTIIFFTLMDALIDNNHPSLDGLSFRQKYNGLPGNNDLDIISKEIYRILKIFRNAATHSKNTISVRNNMDIIIAYKHNKTNFNLHMTKTYLELIYTCIFIMIGDYGYKENYEIGLIRTIYDEIKNGIVDIQDDFGSNNLASISNELRLKRIVRYKVINPVWKEDSVNGVIIIEKHMIHSSEVAIYSCDYFINYLGKQYLVPDEILEADGSIRIKLIPFWEV